MAANISDVAKKADVSTATVSYVLNNTRVVKEETRKKVLKAIEELNYSPNILAKSLKENKSNVIGLLIPDISNYFFTEIAKSIEKTLQKYGYNLILCNTNEDPNLEEAQIKHLQSMMVSGLIIASSDKDRDYTKYFRGSSYPLVFIDRKVSNVQGDSVIVNGYSAVLNAINLLINKGHRKIGFIGGEPNLSTTTERLRGYKDSLKANNIPYAEKIVALAESNVKNGYNLCKTVLTNDNSITALFVASSMMSIGTMQYLVEADITIPDKIALIAYDDYVWALIANPPLTTIKQPTQEIGEMAAKLVIERIKNKDKDFREEILDAEIIIRSSC